MLRFLLFASTLLLLTPDTAAAALGTIDFTLRADGSTPVNLQFATRGPGDRRSQWSQSVARSELAGLDTRALADNRTPVRFALIRPAGRFDCAGTAVRGRASGQCRFSPDPQFAAALQQRGIGRPTEEEAYQLALGRVGVPLVDALQRSGTRPDVEGLIACGIFRVTPELVRSYAALGYSGLSTRQLVEFQIFKVTPDYIRAVGANRRLEPKVLVSAASSVRTSAAEASGSSAPEATLPNRSSARRSLLGAPARRKHRIAAYKGDA